MTLNTSEVNFLVSTHKQYYLIIVMTFDTCGMICLRILALKLQSGEEVKQRAVETGKELKSFSTFLLLTSKHQVLVQSLG